MIPARDWQEASMWQSASSLACHVPALGPSRPVTNDVWLTVGPYRSASLLPACAPSFALSLSVS
eukprot:1147998-Rhodomonas_salina.2